jgi:hypothetical protein
MTERVPKSVESVPMPAQLYASLRGPGFESDSIGKFGIARTAIVQIGRAPGFSPCGPTQITSGLPTIHELAQFVLTRRMSALSHDELCPRSPRNPVEPFANKLASSNPISVLIRKVDSRRSVLLSLITTMHLESVLVLLTVLLVVHLH